MTTTYHGLIDVFALCAPLLLLLFLDNSSTCDNSFRCSLETISGCSSQYTLAVASGRLQKTIPSSLIPLEACCSFLSLLGLSQDFCHTFLRSGAVALLH